MAVAIGDDSKHVVSDVMMIRPVEIECAEVAPGADLQVQTQH